MEHIWLDIRFAIRTLAKRPGFTAVVVLTLACGIGANTAIFNLVNGVLLRPLPYPEPENIVRLLRTYEGTLGNSVSYLNAVDWREQNTVFGELAWYRGGTITLSGAGDPEVIDAGHVAVSFFQVLGITPHMGRFFAPEESQSGTADVVILTYGLWQRKFGADSSIVGQTVVLDETPHLVIGVTSRRFGFGMPGWEQEELWLPFVPASFERRRGNRSARAIARMKPDTSFEAVVAEMETISARLGNEYPDDRVGGVQIVPLHEQLAGGVRRSLFTFLGAVGFVLAIAIANVTSLMLGRATDRQRELALRAAIGAGRRRIMQQLITESLVLASLGGVIGLGLALVVTNLLVTLSAGSIPLSAEVAADGRVLLFVVLVTAVTGILLGASPAFRATDLDLNKSLKEGGSSSGRSHQRLRGTLVVAEVALSLMLLVGAGLLIKSFWRLTHVDTGIETANVLTFQVSPPRGQYPSDASLNTFFDDVMSRLGALPGVREVGAAHGVPLDGNNTCGGLYAADQPPPPPGSDRCAQVRAVRDGYLRAMGIPLLSGRSFTDADDADSPPVVLINQTLAGQLWPGEEPIGKMMYTGFRHPLEVVGVVHDVVNTSIGEVQPPQTYLPWTQWTWRRMTIVVRTAGADPVDLLPAIRQVVWSVEENVPLTNIHTMEEYISRSVAAPRFRTVLLGSLAGVALLLAIVGIYGVLSYSVAQRGREMAIRIALGAPGNRVIRLVVKQGMTLVLIGVALGLGAAFALTRLLSGFLFNVEATDPVAFALLPVVLLAVALGAVYIPARRATHADPVSALKHE